MFPYEVPNEFDSGGRLRQVDYATKATELKNIAVGVVGTNCVVIACTHPEVSPLVVSNGKSIHKIDDTIISAFVGLEGDARPLVNGAQQKVAHHRFEYGETPSLKLVTSVFVERMQGATMHCSSRPFGVAVLLAGISDGPKLVKIPANIEAQEVKAGAIGKNATMATEFLEEHYNESELTTEEATVNLAIRALLRAGTLTANAVDVYVLQTGHSNCKELKQNEKQSAIEQAING